MSTKKGTIFKIWVFMQENTLSETPATVSFIEKVESLKKVFNDQLTLKEKYEKIIRLGKELPPIDKANICSENLVKGCQSELYVHAELRDNQVFFSASSDALISKGLAALLIQIYNGEDIETVLSSPPHFLETLGIHASLSLNRSQGISYIYLKMKLQTIMLAKNALCSNK